MASLVDYVGRQPHTERKRIIQGQHQRALLLGEVNADLDIAVFGADRKRARNAWWLAKDKRCWNAIGIAPRGASPLMGGSH